MKCGIIRLTTRLICSGTTRRYRINSWLNKETRPKGEELQVTSQAKMIKDAKAAIVNRKPGRFKLVYDKPTRSIVAVRSYKISKRLWRALVKASHIFMPWKK